MSGMNWTNLISDLIRWGMTQAEIAADIGVKQPTISGILSGSQKDMRWQNGERLRALHANRKAKATPAPAPTQQEAA
ncbi:hypothetical protein D9M72_82940 [compost metagenome]